MPADLSLSHLVLQASLPVQLVMLALLAASVASWFVVFQKRGLLRETGKAADWFEDYFWSGGNLSDIYKAVMRRGENPTGLEGLFRAGFEELRRQRQHGRVSAEDLVTAVQRSMRAAMVREVERIEEGLALLATVGSTSPYVGLFGTVWGIMNAFIGIGNVKQATLAVVAPAIAEALIATAMGLFAAIPAVIFYNIFTNTVDKLESRYSAFMEEFAGIVQRGVLHENAGPPEKV
ncbi:MAG: protein TolQ [Nevskiales bacterium]